MIAYLLYLCKQHPDRTGYGEEFIGEMNRNLLKPYRSSENRRCIPEVRQKAQRQHGFPMSAPCVVVQQHATPQCVILAAVSHIICCILCQRQRGPVLIPGISHTLHPVPGIQQTFISHKILHQSKDPARLTSPTPKVSFTCIHKLPLPFSALPDKYSSLFDSSRLLQCTRPDPSKARCQLLLFEVEILLHPCRATK